MVWHWLLTGWHWLIVLFALALLVLGGFALFYGEDEHYVVEDDGVTWRRVR